VRRDESAKESISTDDGFTSTGAFVSPMSFPPSDTRHSQRMRDALFSIGSIAGFLFVSGFLGYGNFVTTLPGLVLLVVTGYLGFRLSRR
jgi:hypothetical protein